ncbi:(S)-mandelate dehydrogenase [Paraburkholderia xenovorans LB400]|uniref:S-mandelate dehydrogenase (MdlB) n=1 Tax=Paraburkholderia xenovorans (strain LB400) TaxID=266265 RepID=Q13JD7_PARXL|nr:alpha-hydroxy-acid oxidizing protein [Paraburkholderia xenovorans]ABE35802.1 S-mandelate dehydrogenase (MdlB) [Paraburkholderia xenovorans LB400]AIP36133.1 (S)-mandelate dehydrogenase [Paraburkholderia xenovorans LB400]
MSKPLNIEDYRRLARKRLPRIVFDYLDGGAEDEIGLQHNRDAFRSVKFQPRRLVDISKRTTTASLFGKSVTAPLVIAPTGLNGIFWPDGDLALVRAAGKFDIPFALSTASTSSIEKVADAATGDIWFQLYVVHRKLAELLVKRALAAGYSTLVLTTDVGVNGKRERDARNGFGMPIKYSPRTIVDGILHPRWSLDLVRHGVPQLANFASDHVQDTELQAALMSRQMDASFAWDDLKWLRDLWPRTLLIKGISRADDAARCFSLGADGVILSNHGGRQLDSAIAPIEALRETAAQLHKPILIDSGIRRGSDVVKALALGAQAVLLGRATLYGLASRGEAGVADVLSIIQNEIDITLAQIGCTDAASVTSDFLWSGVPHHRNTGSSQMALTDGGTS